MSVTVDCGEGKHTLCTGTGRTAYLFPQESRALDEPEFNCGCRCHHDGTGVPCRACVQCPGCSVSLPEDDLAGQRSHMEREHPEIVAERRAGSARWDGWENDG